MTLLNEADEVYLGATAADRVYLGANLVWSSAPAYPAILDSAVAWLDATQDGFANGATITSYTSHSTSGRVFTGSSAVTYLTAVDGMPRLYFNGGWLKSASYTPPASGFTFVMVNRFTAAPPAGPGMPMVYNEDAFNNYEMRVSAFFQIQMVYEYSATGGSAVITQTGVETVGQDYLNWCEWNTVLGGLGRMYINNVFHGSFTSPISGITTPTAALIVGARGYSGDYPAVMQVGEAIVFNGVLSDADRTAVSDYLIAKWGL